MTVLFLASTTCAQQGLQVEFYNGREFDEFVSTSVVENISLFWDDVPPVPGITPHFCSIRWTGRLMPPKSGTYYFSAWVDDGIRVWLGDELIIDRWDLHDRGFFRAEVQLEADRYYNLKVEYFNALREGEVQLIWKIPTGNNWFKKLFGEGQVLINSQYFYLPIVPLDTNRQEASADIAQVQVAFDSNPKKVKVKKQVSKKKIVSPFPEEKTASPQNPPPRIVPTISDPNNMTLEVIEMFIPQHVQFGQGQVEILASSFPGLDSLAQFMVLNSYLNLRIEGHTDVAGDQEKNMTLSERRAYAVAKYLVSKGVKPDVITAVGMGGTKPLVKTSGKLYHPENRRVSFLITVP